MNAYDIIAARAAQDQLAIFGALQAGQGADLPQGVETLLLLSPMEPGFWAHVQSHPAFDPTSPDPIDSWSEAVISDIAAAFGGQAFFPFSGPPYAPFVDWAKASGRAWNSPLGMLVHETAGLMVSYRGAIGLPRAIPLPVAQHDRPCETCEKPCLTACPIDAFSDGAYDVKSCHSYIEADPTQECLTNGCLARRACPVSANYGRLAEQSAFHMRRFHP